LNPDRRGLRIGDRDAAALSQQIRMGGGKATLKTASGGTLVATPGPS
jgi:hypothetical protein